MLDKKDLSLYTQIGSGVEGIVYDIGNNNVAKIFNKIDLNKMEKMYELKNLKINNFIFPKEIIINDGLTVGYTMEKINELKTSKKEMFFLSINEKMKYLKKLENNMKKAHQNDIVIVDFNYDNFILSNNELLMVDTDNYTYKKYPTNIYPKLYDFYAYKVENKVTPNLDKFIFTLKLLDSAFDKPVIRYLYNLEDYIERLPIDKETQEFLKMQLSDSKQKEYFNNYFESFKSETRRLKLK